jgi:HPt (histidine-containing phosphotransfer) domain-containing protein
MSAVPTIDAAQLELMTGGDAELAAEALGIFRNQTETWSRLLDPSADPGRWADACHAIKGAARSVGAMALGEACHAAEHLGRSGGATPLAASVALGAVRDRMNEAVEALAELEHRLLVRRRF